MKVRRMLTEILLDVTHRELEDIAREVHRKAKLTASKGTWSDCKLRCCIMYSQVFCSTAFYH